MLHPEFWQSDKNIYILHHSVHYYYGEKQLEFLKEEQGQTVLWEILNILKW